MDKIQIETLRTKLLAGLQLTFERLVLQKRKNDEELIFSPDGKSILSIKARDIVLEKEKNG